MSQDWDHVLRPNIPVLVWHFFQCSLLVQILFTKPFFYVNIENSKSSVFQLVHGVPQGSLVLFSSPYTPVRYCHIKFSTNLMLMIINFSYHSQPWNSLIISLTLKTLLLTYQTFSLLILPKTKIHIFGLPQQLSKLNNPTIHVPNNVILSPVDSAHNMGVIFVKNH